MTTRAVTPLHFTVPIYITITHRWWLDIHEPMTTGGGGGQGQPGASELIYIRSCDHPQRQTVSHPINLCVPPTTTPLTFQQGPQLLDGTCLSLWGLPQLPLRHLQGHIVQVFQLEAQCKLAQLDRRQLVHVRKHCIDSCGGGRQGIWWLQTGKLMRYTGSSDTTKRCAR